MVSRAYLNPQNAEVKANFRVFPGFMGVFWNLGWMELQIGSICCTYNKHTSKKMWCLYNRFGFPAVPVTKVRQTLPQCVDMRKIHPVMRVNVPHASVHALGLALIVTSAISEPARVIAAKSALILRRQATAPLAISAITSAPVLALIAGAIRITTTITVSLLIAAITHFV